MVDTGINMTWTPLTLTFHDVDLLAPFLALRFLTPPVRKCSKTIGLSALAKKLENHRGVLGAQLQNCWLGGSTVSLTLFFDLLTLMLLAFQLF